MSFRSRVAILFGPFSEFINVPTGLPIVRIRIKEAQSRRDPPDTEESDIRSIHCVELVPFRTFKKTLPDTNIGAGTLVRLFCGNTRR